MKLAGNDKRISIGIGISTGEVMAGIFGSSEKKGIHHFRIAR